jgi:effector-binding domain-containing protein
MAVEKAAHKILIKEGNFEVRLYEPMIIATTAETDLRGYSGFNKLFNYISGKNQESKKIAMTAPVINNLEGKQTTTAFVMPKAYSLKDLPQPLHSELQLAEIPERHVAAVIFSGNINPQKIEQKKLELSAWLKEKQITITGSFELARYNPPFIPGFIKRNEVLVAVKLPG